MLRVRQRRKPLRRPWADRPPRLPPRDGRRPCRRAKDRTGRRPGVARLPGREGTRGARSGTALRMAAASGDPGDRVHRRSHHTQSPYPRRRPLRSLRAARSGGAQLASTAKYAAADGTSLSHRRSRRPAAGRDPAGSRSSQRLEICSVTCALGLELQALSLQPSVTWPPDRLHIAVLLPPRRIFPSAASPLENPLRQRAQFETPAPGTRHPRRATRHPRPKTRLSRWSRVAASGPSVYFGDPISPAVDR
jgi:hypothetical protein